MVTSTLLPSGQKALIFYCVALRAYRILTYTLGGKYFRNLYLPPSAFPLKTLDNISRIGSGARVVASSHRESALSLDNISRTGSGARVVASSHRESTLRGIKASNLYDYFK